MMHPSRLPPPASRRQPPVLTDLDLMRIHIRALFQMDDQDRLLAVNEPDPPQAPRLFVGRTATGDVRRFRHDLPDEIVHDLDTLLRAEPPATDLTQPPQCLGTVQDLLTRHAPVTETEMGPAWRFPARIQEPSHQSIRVTPENDAVVREIFSILADDLPFRQPCLVIVREGRLASICFSARNTPEAAEAGLETIEEFRDQGFATAVVSAWAQAVRQQGRIPLYSTSWDNLASRAVARKLGLVRYGADLSIE